MAEEAPRGNARDESSKESVRESVAMEEVRNLDSKRRVMGPDANARSWNLWGAPETVLSIFGYDPEGQFSNTTLEAFNISNLCAIAGDADFAVIKYLQENRPWHRVTGVSHALEEKWTGWYLPPEQVGRIAKSRGTKL